jgi:NitT/TauT family transport system substrate-binding protein
MIQALSSGTLDVYVAVSRRFCGAREGHHVRVIAATVVEEMGFGASASFAPYFEGRTQAQAFKAFREKTGRRAKLATQPIGSGPHTTLNYWLAEVIKADKADYEILEMGIDATQRAILTGAVEGGSIREPALTIVRRQNPAIKLIANGSEMFPNFPGVVVAVLAALLPTEPEGGRKSSARGGACDETPERRSKRAAPHVSAAFGKGLVAEDILLDAIVAARRNSRPIRAASSTRLQNCRTISQARRAGQGRSLDGLFALPVYDRAVANNRGGFSDAERRLK